MKIAMQPEEFRLIRDFVADESGFLIDDERISYLSSRLQSRVAELRLGSFLDYYTFLKFSPSASEEFKQLISILTNNETYFFREDSQLQVFSSEMLPQLKEKNQEKEKRKIRILSAGCSSGEEAYTIAMLLLDSGQFLWNWDIMVTGIDIDPKMIARARSGLYSGRAFQSTPPHFIDRYFTRLGEDYQVKDSLRKITRFEEGNLLKLNRPDNNDPAQIIFCRNVFIYFSEESTKKIVRNFSELLEPEGYLFLGHSESLSRVSSVYQPIRYPGAIIYRKRD